jgi:multidrug efflux pump subunit AcrA (membrane-fusion protein)
LDTSDLDLDIAKGRADMAAADINSGKSLVSAQSALLNAETALNTAKNIYDISVELYEAGAIAGHEFDESETALIDARNKYDEAKTGLELAGLGNAGANEAAAIALQKLEKQKAEAVIKAPIAGTVTYSAVNEGVAASGVAFVIENEADLKLTTTVGELDIPSIAIGQQVIIKTDAIDNEEFIGEVSVIAPTAAKGQNGVSGGSTEFVVEISINSFDERLEIGMSANAEIILESRFDVFAVPFDAITTDNYGNSTVYVLKEGEKTPGPVVVTTGIESYIDVEINGAGLSEGLKYVTNPGSVSQGAGL